MTRKLQKALELVTVESMRQFQQRCAQSNQPSELVPEMTLVESTLERIQQFPQPLHVLAIAGKAREGKTTLCLLIIKYLMELAGEALPTRLEDLFRARGGDETVTSGIWIWSDPLPLPNGRGWLLLVDTEGIERGHDTLTAQLTSLSCAMSSLFALHINGGLKNTDLSALARITNALDMDGSQADVQSVFPKLAVVSRSVNDEWLHSLGLLTDEDLETASPPCNLSSAASRQRLDRKLEERLQDGRFNDNLDAERRVIRGMFVQRCYAVSRTAENSEVVRLRQTETKPFPQVDFATPFGASVKSVLERLLDEVTVKSIQGAAISPAVLTQHVRNVFINLKDTFINFPSVVYFAHEQQGKEMMKTNLDQLQARMLELCEVSDDMLQFEPQFVQALQANRAECERQLRARHLLPSVIDAVLGMFDARAEIVKNAGRERINQKMLQAANQRIAAEQARNDRNEQEIERQRLLAADLQRQAEENRLAIEAANQRAEANERLAREAQQRANELARQKRKRKRFLGIF